MNARLSREKQTKKKKTNIFHSRKCSILKLYIYDSSISNISRKRLFEKCLDTVVSP